MIIIIIKIISFFVYVCVCVFAQDMDDEIRKQNVEQDKEISGQFHLND